MRRDMYAEQASESRARWDDRGMELTDLSGSVRVVLHPVKYQFESVVGDIWDDNWLIIEGDVDSGEAKWSFRDPSLVVDEALEIANWLERVGTQFEGGTRCLSTALRTEESRLTFPNATPPRLRNFDELAPNLLP